MLAAGWNGPSRQGYWEGELVALSQQEAIGRALQPHGLHLLASCALLVDLLVDVDITKVLVELLSLGIFWRHGVFTDLLGLDLVFRDG
jgi:hypothetical protein